MAASLVNPADGLVKPVGVFQYGEAPPEHGLHFREYRHHDVALDERKINLHSDLMATQAQVAQTIHAQDRLIDDCLYQQGTQLTHALMTHRRGFERPTAALAMYEPRHEGHDEKHRKWVQAQIECQRETQQYQNRWKGKSQLDYSRYHEHKAKLEQLQEVQAKAAVLRADVLQEAERDEQRYGEHKKVPVEEMNRRQTNLVQDLQKKQAQISKDAEQHRKDAAAMRMKGIVQMQQKQRSLRHHVELDQAHSQLRVMKVMERSKEQRRALSLGTPHWTYPRPTTV